CYEFIDYYGGERADVLPLLPPDLGPESSVLEVGCGRGATAALISERFGCHTVGIELNPEAARAAESRLDRVIRGDVQAVEPGETFDAIVAFELFEHLTDGQAFLERAAGWLRPGGRMVFSVPNVGHYSVVEDLVAGRWDYIPMGLLCATHVRFFTRRTLEDWLHAAGFDRYRIDAQTTPLPPRIDALPASMAPDRESLATAGFYVSIFT
ncbi:MAG: class I SAM-dependent methyltransferase, partial [Acidobacteria bacterium]|nr:class I SAM-dependent methyltransferase [Acidobacteriota bacterium]